MRTQPPLQRSRTFFRPRGGVESIFRVFADKTRLRILCLLQDGPLCVSDLILILEMPQPTVSRHLKYLRRTAFVQAKQYGLWVFYTLAPARDDLHKKLFECLVELGKMVPEIAEDARKAKKLRASGGCCPEGSRYLSRFPDEQKKSKKDKDGMLS